MSRPPGRATRRARCALAGLLPVLLVGLLLGVLGADLTPAERAQVLGVLAPRAPLLVILAVFIAAACGAWAWWLTAAYAQGCLDLADALELGPVSDAAPCLPAGRTPELALLAARLTQVLGDLEGARRNVAAQVAQARAAVEQERNQLAALVAEMPQCVLACNREGVILLYNARARDLLGDEAGRVGLGRPIGGIFDRRLLAHTRERLYRGLQSGRTRVVASFVTSTAAGRLVRIRATPVLAAEGADAPLARLVGYILLGEDVSREAEHAARRDRLLEGLTQMQRAGLASIRVAAENLIEFGDMEAAQRARFLRVIFDQAVALSERVARSEREFSDVLRADVALEDMLGEDLLAAAQRRIEARTQVSTRLENVHQGVWLRVESFALVQALTTLAQRVCEACAVRELRLALEREGSIARLELIWTGSALSTETALGWEIEPMTLAGEASPRSIREVLARHDGEMLYGRERASARSYFHVLLPCGVPAVTEAEALPTPAAARPQFYDFDLFAWSARDQGLAERPLADLVYTVFDTETTGLDPSGGDEIIQIGALRIVNGRVLQGECFEALVDPRRAIDPAAQAVHGISNAQLAGQPGIEQVLPAFHAFARDTVLVAHNAAFDMRFLQLKEGLTGLRFDQPVLDTLLLSAVLHPGQESHRLEAIAQRFGVAVTGRHDARADAHLTAQLFLRMLPLLAARGIVTLAQARAASEKTYHARIQY